MYVSLSNLPSKPKEYVIDLPRLDGGLNLWDLDYRMDADQSPEMKNLSGWTVLWPAGMVRYG